MRSLMRWWIGNTISAEELQILKGVLAAAREIDTCDAEKEKVQDIINELSCVPGGIYLEGASLGRHNFEVAQKLASASRFLKTKVHECHRVGIATWKINAFATRNSLSLVSIYAD